MRLMESGTWVLFQFPWPEVSQVSMALVNGPGWAVASQCWNPTEKSLHSGSIALPQAHRGTTPNVFSHCTHSTPELSGVRILQCQNALTSCTHHKEQLQSCAPLGIPLSSPRGYGRACGALGSTVPSYREPRGKGPQTETQAQWTLGDPG
jgi:hypothetical protein